MSMSVDEIGSLALTLSVLIAAVHGLGYVFERLKQPRLIGEILVGALLGPFVLRRLMPGLSTRLFAGVRSEPNQTNVVLNFIDWIGLFLLMFLSGSETRRLMAKENQRQTVSSTVGNMIQNITHHVLIAFIYMVIGLTVVPRFLKRLNVVKWNILIIASPVGYLFLILFLYAAIAALLDVNLVFAAFRAGFGVVGGLS